MLFPSSLNHFKKHTKSISFVYFEVIVGMSSVAVQLFYLSRISQEAASAAILAQPFIITIFSTVTALCYAINSHYNLKKETDRHIYLAGLFLVASFAAIFYVLLNFLANHFDIIYQLDSESLAQTDNYLSCMALYVIFYAFRQYCYVINVNQHKAHLNTLLSIVGIITNIIVIEYLFVVDRLNVSNLILTETLIMLGIILVHVWLRRKTLTSPLPGDLKNAVRSCHCILVIAFPSMLEPALYELSQLAILKILSNSSIIDIQVYGYVNTLFLCAIAWSIASGQVLQLQIRKPNNVAEMNNLTHSRRQIMSSATFITLLIICCLAVFKHPASAIFSNNTAVIETLSRVLLIGIILEPLRCLSLLNLYALKGLGHTYQSNTISILCTWCIGIPSIFFLIPSFGIAGVLFGKVIEEMGRTCFLSLMWKRQLKAIAVKN